MPFNNDIAGGNGSLVRNWIQSPNFVSGSSGWRIAKDGSCEFNNGTFRGSITSGNPAAAHIVINNVGGTGDAVDIYNALNQLVYSIDSNGNATSTDFVTGKQSINQAGKYVLGNTGTNDSMIISAETPAGNAAQPDLRFEVDVSPGVGLAYIGKMLAGSRDGTKLPTFVGGERNINGSYLQSDLISNANLVHVSSYTGTVFDAFGDVNINHMAAFTPVYGLITSWDWNNSGVMYQYSWWQNPFTATQIKFFARTISGGTPPNGTTVGVHVVLFG